jgi:tetratricopeptide (TPR) repeat protein
LLAIALIAVVTARAIAGPVSAETHSDYTRLSFAFDQPVKMQLGGGGNSVILTFDQPLTESAVTLQPKLAAIANGVQQSADRKQVIINLKKNYRIRQFVSANTVGIDIMNGISQGVRDEGSKRAPTTPTPAPVPKPIALPATKEPVKIITPPPVSKPESAPIAPKPEMIEPPAPAPEAKVIRSEPSPVLTTKKIEPAPAAVEQQPIPAAEPVQEPIKAPAPAAVLTTKEPPAPAKPTGDGSLSNMFEPATTPAAPAKPELKAIPAPDRPFLVDVQATKEGSVMNFPWKERTASAIFQRGNDVWIVFSRMEDAGVELLRTVLPKSVIKIEQFDYPGNTVLRLVTDGTLHATASQPKGSYGWKILLSTQIPQASLDVPVSGEHDVKGKQYLLLNVFDIDDPLQFYDPENGDLLVVVPTYELGRGTKHFKSTPALTIMETQQGVAIASLRDGLSTKSDRTGVKIYGMTSLAVSQNLPVLSADTTPVPGVSAASNVMLPYDQWYVAPEDFMDERASRLRDFSEATETHKPTALLAMVQLYLGQAQGIEGLGYLQLIQQGYPDFYRENKLALLAAVSNVLANRMGDAAIAINAAELNDLAEAELWRQAIGLFGPPPAIDMAEEILQEEHADEAKKAAAPKVDETMDVEEEDEEEEVGEKPVDEPQPTGEMPTLPPAVAEEATVQAMPTAPVFEPPPPPNFDYLKFNKSYIRFYPPRIRQRLAIIAADNYLKNDQPEKAIAVFDSLNADGIMRPVQPYAEYMVGEMAAAKGKTKEALRIFDKMTTQQDDLYIQARARYAAIMLRFKQGMMKEKDVAEALERIRIFWRGDGLERELLYNLGIMYEKDKQYDNTLRIWKQLLENFPADGNTLTISGDMTELFSKLFLDGMADDMPPVRALALFYEFPELTPIGAKGDLMIQNLADRLAALDLIDRATRLLEHQIRYRLAGEERARVGARLSLLYLLNNDPKRALEVLQITSYGGMPSSLQRQRLQLMARALMAKDSNESALGLLENDTSAQASALRLDIFWKMQDWPNVINEAEEILAARSDLTATLNDTETQVLLRLALAYSFAGDYTQLRYLRDYYMGLMPNTRYKEVFDFITNDTTPLDAEDFALVAKQISRTENFLDTFRSQIAQGRLSDTIK